ncbi:atlastin-1-like isoform X1 [Clavelina lepadiformis]|uniref:atlastin-1-like isoform X1 n=1 Tax=Clavelina lepadiformis TaxID=159417 RepID=UPI0040434255
MDTQGLFDHNAGTSDSSVIAGISFLMSSCQIFNVKSELESTHLQHIYLFTDFADEVRKLDEGISSPFQSLVFVVRDWQHTDKFGFHSGREYLDHIMDKKDGRSSEHLVVQDKMQKTFRNISCFTFPHPGTNVTEMTEKDDLKIKDIDNGFIKKSIELSERLFNQQTLLVKQIDNQNLTGSKLYEIMRGFAKAVDEGFVANPKSYIQVQINLSQFNFTIYQSWLRYLKV